MSKVFTVVHRNDQCPHCYEISTAKPELIIRVSYDEQNLPDTVKRMEIRTCETCGIKWSRVASDQNLDKSWDL